MIPLSRSDHVPDFPYRIGQLVTGILILLWSALEIRFYFVSEPRSSTLLEGLYHPGKSWTSLLTGLMFFQNTFSMAINAVFAWVFFPMLFYRVRNVLLVPASLAAIWVSAFVFFKIHPYLAIPIPVADAWIGFFLGAVMRSDVWGNVDTWVFGPSITKVFKVPSYVLLFFWFFYLMIANLFLPEPFSNLPMIYWMPFASFIQGFLFESLLRVLPLKRAK